MPGAWIGERSWVFEENSPAASCLVATGESRKYAWHRQPTSAGARDKLPIEQER